jgi:hypothetical protein
VHPAGSLHLAQSGFLTAPPVVSPNDLARFEAQYRARGMAISHDVLSEITTPHIASPDVHIDVERRRIVMYFHGLDGVGHQVSRAAISQNGIDFTARPEVLGRSYMRIFQHDGMTYALTMPGTLSRSADGLSGFETGPTLFNPNMRHAAVLKRSGALWVFWSQVGDAPERILLSRIALDGDWHCWRDEPPVEVMRPELPWEGATAPNLPSVRSTAYGVVNQLRDPAIYEESGRDLSALRRRRRERHRNCAIGFRGRHRLTAAYRSATQPQICCATTPAPSWSDSIAAPARALTPQTATMCASWIDMVTQ